MRPKMLCLLAAALGLALGGCSLKLGDGTSGELGRVDFSYTTDCLGGCSMDRSLLVGSEASIGVTSVGDDPGVSAASSAPGVATFSVQRSCSCNQSTADSSSAYVIDAGATCPSGWSKQCDNTIQVAALSEGDTELELHDRSGQLIDRTPVHVRAPSSVAFLQDDRTADAFQLKLGQSSTLAADFSDAEGRSMIVTGGVTWSSADPTVAGFLAPGALSSPASDRVELTGKRTGTTQIRLEAPGLERTLPVTVVQ